MTDPVTLSGGPMGGEDVEGEGWNVGEEKTFGAARYRREGRQAVYVGDN